MLNDKDAYLNEENEADEDVKYADYPIVRCYSGNATIIGPKGWVDVSYTGDDLDVWYPGGAGGFGSYEDAIADYEATLRSDEDFRDIGLTQDGIDYAVERIMCYAGAYIGAAWD